VKRFWNDQLFWPSGLKLEHEQSAAYVSDFLQLHLYPNTPEIALNFSEGEKNKEIRDRHEASLFKDLRTAPIDANDANLFTVIETEKEEQKEEVKKEKIENEKNESIKKEEIVEKTEDVVMKSESNVKQNKKIENKKEQKIKNEEKKMVEVEKKIDDVGMKNIEKEKNVGSTNVQIEKKEEANILTKKKKDEMLRTPGAVVPPISENLSQSPIILKTPPQTSMMDVAANVFLNTEVTEVKELKTEIMEELPSPIPDKSISIDLKIRPTQGLLETWNCQEVSQFLHNLHLEKYSTIFMENVVDGAVLISLDNEQCEALGIKLFHRPKLLRTVKEFVLQDAQEQP